MFAQFALVVVFAISLSLLDATMSVPMLASRIIRGEAHRGQLSNGHRPGLMGARSRPRDASSIRWIPPIGRAPMVHPPPLLGDRDSQRSDSGHWLLTPFIVRR